MAEFVYFRNDCSIWYPVGEYFSEKGFNYIREAAYSINKIFPTGELILVVRGHSGSILVGGIAYILKRKGRNVLISVSRKSEPSHGDNLEGIHLAYITDDTHIIVIDDFVYSGETIKNIIKDLTGKLGVEVFDMLCIANEWNKCLIEEGKGKTNKYWEEYKRIASHFKYIVCNKPDEE